MRSEATTRRYRAAPDYDDIIKEIEVRHFEGEAEGIDEIIVKGALHLETLDYDSAYLDIGGLRFNIWAERIKGTRQLRLVIRCEPDNDTPLVQ